MEDVTRVIHTEALVKVSKPYQPGAGGRNTLNVKFGSFEV